MRIGSFRKLTLAGFALFGSIPLAQAAAGTLQVNPVLVEIGANRRTGLVTLRNAEQQPITIRAYALDWSQATGEDVYTENRTDLILSPPVFTIPPGGTQNLRVGQRRPTPAPRAYRLMIEEVPEARIAGAVQVAIRLNLPLYVNLPPDPVTKLVWSASRSADGRYVVRAVNRGKGYVRLDPAAARVATGLAIGEDLNLGTVLPGATRRWTLGSAVSVSDAATLGRILRNANGDAPPALPRTK